MYRGFRGYVGGLRMVALIVSVSLSPKPYVNPQISVDNDGSFGNKSSSSCDMRTRCGWNLHFLVMHTIVLTMLM